MFQFARFKEALLLHCYKVIVLYFYKVSKYTKAL